MSSCKIDQATLTRNRIAQAIDVLINLLDQIEGDVDFEDIGDYEPYLSNGAAIWISRGDSSDLERVDFDHQRPVMNG